MNDLGRTTRCLPIVAVVALGAFGCTGAKPSARATAQSRHRLVVMLDPLGHSCLLTQKQPPLGRHIKKTDQFQLRSPPFPFGRLLARATAVYTVRRGCALIISFVVPIGLGKFSFYDRSNGGIWGGFDTAVLRRREWRLRIVVRPYR